MNRNDPTSKDESTGSEPDESGDQDAPPEVRPKEIGGRKGPDPTRYGDWEKGGRCIDF